MVLTCFRLYSKHNLEARARNGIDGTEQVSRDSMEGIFSKYLLQIGVCYRSGVEAIVHASNNHINVVTKLDVANAFNTVDRELMIERLLEYHEFQPL